MKKLIFTCFLVLYLNISFAQVSSETTIDDKFETLITTSNNFKGYKVVNADELSALQLLTSKRIAQLKEEMASTQQATVARDKEIAELQQQLESLEAQLEEVTAEKESISIMGMQMSKAGYNTLMWSIIGILAAALALFVIKFRKSHVHTSEAKKNLVEIEKEFDAYRVKALEKEQRLGRLLQDEKNKQIKMVK